MIEVEHLSKHYGATAAIEDVDFSVEQGEILGFLGPNGAGKTTTMRILSGYIPATTGTAIIAGYDVHQQSLDVRRNIGYLPETPPLYPDMTVEGFLHFVARIKGVAAGDRHSRVNWSMERCQLQEKRKVLIRKLSKGYKQRVGIAQAIVHDPPVIILDEPTVGLDPKQIIEVRNLIKSLAGEHTILLSTHILPEVSMTCDRVTIINGGKVVATDTPDNLMSHLTAKGGYEIEIEGDIFSLESALKTLPGVTQLEIKSNSYTKRHTLYLTIDSEEEIGNHLATLIVNQGLDLYEMKRTRVTLEEVFLNLITEESSPEATPETSSIE
ncbi:ABC transporter ATP-binding protein [Crocosphaera sp.]|uniref:ABC transporter ATP-binding protein n=1 Tax=Crocosphaera sp. TaxID=2729996 RepID=UPI003F1E779B